MDQREFRQAVHTILVAVASESYLQDNMCMKGGILVAVGYLGDRFTRDIDFSTSLLRKELDLERFRSSLELSLARAVELLEYDLDCRIQGFDVEPGHMTDANFPSLSISIGHALKGSKKHKRLMAGQSPSVVRIDYSFNEPMSNIGLLKVGEAHSIRAYDLSDLIAEKYRALLQQKTRARYRRQDVYDIAHLLRNYPCTGVEMKIKILDSIKLKGKSRDLAPSQDDLRDQEIRRRAESEYNTLADEIESDLPAFDVTYGAVRDYYESLPWK